MSDIVIFEADTQQVEVRLEGGRFTARLNITIWMPLFRWAIG